MTDMTKRIAFDEVNSAMAFENKAYSNGIVGEVRYLHSWWREGAKWQFAEMQAQTEELNYALKFQTNSLDREMNMTEKLQIENNSLKQALDLAVNGLNYYIEFFNGDGNSYQARQALTSINEIINKTKQGESK